MQVKDVRELSGQDLIEYELIKIRFVREERGQDLIEYGLLTSFISIAAVATLALFREPIMAMFQLVLDALG